MRDLRGALSPRATRRHVDILAASVAARGSVPNAEELVRTRPSTAKRYLADLRARSGLIIEQFIYAGRAEGWLVVPSSSLHEGIPSLSAGGRDPSVAGLALHLSTNRAP